MRTATFSVDGAGDASVSAFAFPCVCGSRSVGLSLCHGTSRRGAPVDVRRCGNCELARTFPGPSLATLHAVTYASEEDFQAQIRFASRLDASPILGPLEKRLPADRRRLLDVGCGIGTLLVRARDAGWTVRGLELNERAAAYARRANRLDVDARPVEALDSGDGPYDAITLSHVLEHLEFPHVVLDSLSKRLAPGGIIAVLVPNMSGFYARLLGPWWYGYAVEQHLWHFTPQSIGSIARAANCRLVDVASRTCLDYPVPVALRPLIDAPGALDGGDLMLALFEATLPERQPFSRVNLDTVAQPQHVE